MNTYEKNLELFLRVNPSAKSLIQSHKAANWEWCTTDKNEKNLKRNLQGHSLFLHSRKGAMAEIESWYASQKNSTTKAWFIFGLGLGYHYEVLKKWLRKSPSHFLVLIEDDLEIIQKFLTLEQAFDVLNDPQVIVKHFYLPREDYKLFRDQFQSLLAGFLHHTPSFNALESYRIYRPDIATVLTQMINLAWAEINMTYQTITLHSFPEEFQNFYRNYPYTYQNYLFEKLHGLMPGIPMIMCGAGPSLELNFDLLKELEDKAIIVGGGSALNALSSHYILPHFGGAVDPTISQKSRFLSNFAYEVPILYMWRFNHSAFKIIKGPKLFVKGLVGFPMAFWFESKLGIFKAPYQTDMGISSPTFLTTVLSRLGTTKIILCGMDLSYADKKRRYSSGIEAHPTDIVEEKRIIHSVRPDLVPAKNAQGQTVYTSLQMKYEASYYNEFAMKNPHLSIINTSLTGLEIFNVKHQALDEIEFPHSYDLAGRIHAIIENARINLTFKEIKSAMEEWKTSLENCEKICENLLQKLAKGGIKEFEEDKFFEKQFSEEIAYQVLLGVYVAILEPDFFLDQYQADCHPERFSQEELTLKRIFYFKRRLEFIKRASEWHIERADKGIIIFSERQRMLLTHAKKSFLEVPKKQPQKHTQPNLSASNQAVEQVNEINGKWDGAYRVYYPSGALLGESYYAQGILNGSSKFYDEQKNLLSETDFVNGKREGECWHYYSSGDVYSIERFKHGTRDGQQEYYYLNGTLKTLMNYSDGVLDGKVRIFYENGIPEREISFTKGKLNGFEFGWNPSEKLIHESEYAKGKPVNKSKVWDENGNLIQQYTYYGDTGNYDLIEWDERGKIKRKEVHIAENAFDRVQEKSDGLSKSIADLKAELERIKKEKS